VRTKSIRNGLTPESLLNQPSDVAGLAVFRMLFGALVAIIAARYLIHGWVEVLFDKPSFFFTYWGFSWVRPLPLAGMNALLVALVVLGLCVAAGLFYRVTAPLLWLGFVYLELLDVTNYLNHYYLVSLLSLLVALLPLHRAWSLDVWRKPHLKVSAFPFWYTVLLRFQVGVVYLFAGLAKLGSDWLLHAQPLSIWLSTKEDLWLIGPLLAQRPTWFVFSWAGFLFDTTIVGFLLWRRTRVPAYGTLLVFHILTRVLFPIGMFPFIMSVGALIFFPPSWPRCLSRRMLGLLLRVGRRPSSSGSQQAREAQKQDETATQPWTLKSNFCQLGEGRKGRWVLRALVLYGFVQIALPLRCHLYGGDVLWHEQGMRYSWRVMVREKNGSVTFRVHSPSAERHWEVSPRRYLTSSQTREMSGQPDLILQLGQHIAAQYRKRGFADAEVRVDALVSLNGRPAARLIDPTVDLASLSDGVARASWIRPAPATKPLALRSTATF